jgi:hypothetical protein
VVFRQRRQARHQRFLLGHQDLVARIAQHQGIGEVVDVLGRAGKMEKLAQAPVRVRRGKLFLEKILDGLHVVVCLALDGLDAHRLVQRQPGGEGIQAHPGIALDRVELHDAWLVGKRQQPAGLDRDPVTNQAVLAEYGPQAGGPARVATVHRRDCGEGGGVH